MMEYSIHELGEYLLVIHCPYTVCMYMQKALQDWLLRMQACASNNNSVLGIHLWLFSGALHMYDGLLTIKLFL